MHGLVKWRLPQVCRPDAGKANGPGCNNELDNPNVSD